MVCYGIYLKKFLDNSRRGWKRKRRRRRKRRQMIRKRWRMRNGRRSKSKRRRRQGQICSLKTFVPKTYWLLDCHKRYLFLWKSSILSPLKSTHLTQSNSAVCYCSTISLSHRHHFHCFLLVVVCYYDKA